MGREGGYCAQILRPPCECRWCRDIPGLLISGAFPPLGRELREVLHPRAENTKLFYTFRKPELPFTGFCCVK